MENKTNMENAILVVEDDPEWRDIFMKALHGDGYKAESAKDIREARTALKRQSFDIVVLDMLLDPASNEAQGWELLDEMKPPPYGPHVIVVTESVRDPNRISSLTDKRDFGGYEVYRYLPKTRYTRENFKATVRKGVEEKNKLLLDVPASLKLRSSDEINEILLASELEDLTKTELRVLARLLVGDSNKDIGVHLTIEENTVKTHVRNILAKLQIESRSKILPLALKLDLLK